MPEQTPPLSLTKPGSLSSAVGLGSALPGLSGDDGLLEGGGLLLDLPEASSLIVEPDSDSLLLEAGLATSERFAVNSAFRSETAFPSLQAPSLFSGGVNTAAFSDALLSPAPTEPASSTISAEGVISLNQVADLQGDPTTQDDDATLYAGGGYTINRLPVLPQQRDDALTLGEDYRTLNLPGGNANSLLSPEVVAPRTVEVPSFEAVQESALAEAIPTGAVIEGFNPYQTPLNSFQDWQTHFPSPGTADSPAVVRVTGWGLNIPSGVTLENSIILLENGDINFNGQNHELNNVVLVAENGSVNLSQVQADDLTVLASRSIHMNQGARFAGKTLLANGDQNGITFNGATESIGPEDCLTVISQGRLTFNASAATRGEFFSRGDFSFNSASELVGAIQSKGNITFNSQAKVRGFSDDNHCQLDEATNQAPILPPDASLVVLEDSPATALGIPLPTDPDGDALTITVAQLPDVDKGIIQTAEGRVLSLGETLTPSELAGLELLPQADVFGAAGIFSYRVDDGQGGKASQTLTLGITPVNDAPTVELPPSQTGQQGTVIPITGISVSDIDAADSPLEVSLAVQTGTITLNDLSGITLIEGGQSGPALTFAGTAAAINNALNRLQYQSTSEFIGADALSITVNDQGNTGAGGAQTTTASLALSVTPLAVFDEEVLLVEGNEFKVSATQVFTTPSQPSSLSFSLAELVFDTQDEHINDAFEVALVDATGNPLTHTIGAKRDAFFNSTEGEEELLASGVSRDAQIITVDLTGIQPGIEAQLIFRLVNNDADSTTTARIRDITLTPGGGDADGTGGAVPPLSTSQRSTPVVQAPESYETLQDVSVSFEAEYGRTSLDEETQTLYADIAVRNVGQYKVEAPLYLVIDRISDPSVRVASADGVLATEDGQGKAYYDLSQLAVDGVVDPEEVTDSLTLAFWNPNGGQFDYDVQILGLPDPSILNNQAPSFTSTPITRASVVSSPGNAQAVDLSAWSVVQYDLPAQGAANWEIETEEGGATAVQTQNADASILLSDFDLINDRIEGTWRVEAASDDDFMGFVFGYQDDQHYYLFDWKQGTQNDPLGFAEQGMSIKVIDADSPLDGTDLWPTAGKNGRVRTLFHNTIAWNDFTDYQFQLDFSESAFTIEIKEGETVLETITLEDSTYTSGKFGFYNYSQGPVRYSGFTRKQLASYDYAYDSEAVDPDGDTLKYQLLTGPDGMSVDDASGQIQWKPTAADIGSHSVVLQVEDGKGGQAEQTFAVVVDAPLDGNRAPVITSGPVTDYYLPPAQQAQFVDFSDLSEFRLNGDTATLNPVLEDDQSVLRLVDAQFWQGGSALLQNPFELVDEQGKSLSFQTDFQFQITGSAALGDGDGPGADGIAFIISPTDTVGGAGVGIGYAGIRNTVAVEFDTFFNGGIDPSGNHIGININGELISTTQRTVESNRMNNGEVWHAWIDYDGTTQQLEVRIAESAERPDEAFISQTVDIPEILGQNDIFVGFTSATGSGVGTHDILTWNMEVSEQLERDEYVYQVAAIDPDQDDLTYSLTAAPDGMVIDPQTGEIRWEVPNQDGARVSVKVDDGQGATDIQEFTVNFLEQPLGKIRGTVWNDINGNQVQDAALVTSRQFEVLGTNNPWLAGLPDGTPASRFDSAPDHAPKLAAGLSLTPGQELAFAVSGSVNNDPFPSDLNADGGAFLSHETGSENGISNIVAPVNSLIGIFLSDQQPDGNSAPDTLNFDSGGNVVGGVNYTTLLPQLQQTFFIGDGLTDDGHIQTVTVPDGATKLYLGTMDGFGWFNNFGSFDVEVGTLQQEFGLADVPVYLDLNENGRFDVTEPVQRTASTPETSITTLGIQGTDSIYLAGRTDITVPPLGNSDANFPLMRHPYQLPEFLTEAGPKFVEATAGDIFTFETNGTVDFYNGSARPVGADGDSALSNISNLGRISGYNGPQGSLVGVFLDSAASQSGDSAPSIDFSGDGSGTNFEELSPQLGQVFFIGDGLTETEQGTSQNFIAPQGATRLFLGFADGEFFSGIPGFYEDNDGSLDVEIHRQLSGLSTGQYHFSGLEAGTYVVRQLVPSGYQQTYPSSGQTTQVNFDALSPGLTDSSALEEIGLSIASGDLAGVVAEGNTITLNNRLESFTVLNYEQFSSPPNGVLSAASGGDVLLSFAQPVTAVSLVSDLTQGDPGADTISLMALEPIADDQFEILGVTEALDTGTTVEAGTLSIDLNGKPFSYALFEARTETEGFDDLTFTQFSENGFHTVTLQTGKVANNIDFGNQQIGDSSNQVPVLTSQPPETAVSGTLLRYQVEASDEDGDRLAYALLQAPQGMAIDAERGILIWQPERSQQGPHDVMIQVNDGNGGTAQQTFNLEVLTNQAPAITSKPSRQAISEQPYTYAIEAEDPDGDTITFGLSEAPEGMMLDEATGLLTYTPPTNSSEIAALHNITVTATDTEGNITRQRFALNVLADAAAAVPQITSLPPESILAGKTYRYDLLATAPDGSLLSYSIDGPDGMVIDALGRLTWETENAPAGPQEIEISVTDAQGDVTQQAFTLTGLWPRLLQKWATRLQGLRDLTFKRQFFAF